MKNMYALVLSLLLVSTINFAGQRSIMIKGFPPATDDGLIALEKVENIRKELRAKPDLSFNDVKQLAIAQATFFSCFNTAIQQNIATLESMQEYKHILDLKTSRQQNQGKLQTGKKGLKCAHLIEGLCDVMPKYTMFAQLGATIPEYQSPDELFRVLRNNFVIFCAQVNKY